MVGQLGVAMVDDASYVLLSAVGTEVVTASVFAEYSHAEQRTNVSSPTSIGARNSSLMEPPIAPLIAFTITYGSCRREKMRS